MKTFQSLFIKALINSDTFSLKNNAVDIFFFTEKLKSIKQLVKILYQRNQLPIFIVCPNKQYNILLSKYLRSETKLFLISSKNAVTLKVPGIFLLIDCEDSFFLTKKIYQTSNSVVFTFDQNISLKTPRDYYSILTKSIYLKQILFFISLLKKVTKNYENI